jgi:hypothetical protein
MAIFPAELPAAAEIVLAEWNDPLGRGLAQPPVPGIMEIRQAAGGVCLIALRWLSRIERI